MSEADQYKESWDLFFAGDRRKAAEIANQLVSAGYKPAHMILGLIFEFGGDGYAIDLRRAVNEYRQMAYAAPSDIGYVYLARALMKAGDPESFDSAQRFLEEAKKYGLGADLCLAYGHYYSKKPQPDLKLAGRFYRQAACRGRVIGFKRYAETLRASGHRIRAFAVRAVLVPIGPLLYLLFGKKVLKDF